MMRVLASLILAICAGVAFASGGGETLRRSHFAGPDAIDPHLTRGHGASSTITADLFVGLTMIDAAGDIVPGMAQGWEVSEDRLVYTFHIRKGMRWSDGAPLDAQDFYYSLRRVLTGETPAPFAYYLFPIRNAKAVFEGGMGPDALGVKLLDSHTLQLLLGQPTPYLLDVLSLAVAAPVPRHAIEAHGADWTDPEHIVTNGPYVLVENIPQNRLTLHKNPKFFEHEQVAIEEVVYLIIQDRTTALRRFRAGEVDIDDAGFPGSQLSWLRRHMPKAIRIAPRRQLQYCAINNAAPPLDDRRVRRALSLAVNREVLVRNVLRTPDMPTGRLVPPYTANYGREVQPDYADTPMRQRQAEARRLLAQAGFDEDRPLEVKLAYATDADNKRISVALAAMWKAVGVVTRLYNSESGVHHRSVGQGDYQVARLSWGAEVDDPHSFFFLLTSDSPTNHSRYRNAQYDAWVREAMSTADLARRADLFAAAEMLALEEAALLPLYFVSARNLVSTRVAGWRDTMRFAHPSRYLSIRP